MSYGIRTNRIIALDNKRAHEAFRRERSLNEVIERRHPGLQPTKAYQKGPLSSLAPRFWTEAQYWNYRALFERSKFDPNVKV